jgi:O-antigen ligase
MSQLRNYVYTAPWIILIIFGPLVQNPRNYPYGWEIPKVHFVLLICTILILLSVVDLIVSNKKIFSNLNILLISLLSLYLLFIALISPYVKTAIWGSSFRQQGVILIILILLSLFFTSKYLYSNRKLITYSFILSSIIQMFFIFQNLIPILQLSEPLKVLILGKYVFGTFGQTNFLAGHMLIGAFFSFFLIWQEKSYKIKSLTLIIFILLSFSILVSFSIWAIILLFIGIGTIYISFVLKKTLLVLNESILFLFIILNLLSFKSTLLQLVLPGWLQKEIIARLMYRKVFFQVYLSDIKSFFFGSGPDTLHKHLASHDKLPGITLDRTHDFLLDIMFNGGIILLLIFISIWGYVIYKNSKNTATHDTDIFFQISSLWILRSMVHTSSIINLISFAILFTICTTHTFLHPIDSINPQKTQ